MENKSKELEIAIQAAKEAGKIIEKYFYAEVLKEFKEDMSIVTLADKESEEVIKKIIFENFPEHSILGEETGMTDQNSNYVWYIDPVDGTTNFANGIPIFGISIALMHKGDLIVGVVYNPIIDALFYAEKGKGAYLNDKQIFVSKDDYNHSIISIAASRKNQKENFPRNLFYQLPEKFRSMRILGSTALELAFVARGSLEANIQIGLSSYDFAAGVLLVQEAGGKLTKYDGSSWRFPENYFIASNGVFHDILVEEVSKQQEKSGFKEI